MLDVGAVIVIAALSIKYENFQKLGKTEEKLDANRLSVAE
jgi:hypothetical protein